MMQMKSFLRNGNPSGRRQQQLLLPFHQPMMVGLRAIAWMLTALVLQGYDYGCSYYDDYQFYEFDCALCQAKKDQGFEPSGCDEYQCGYSYYDYGGYESISMKCAECHERTEYDTWGCEEYQCGYYDYHEYYGTSEYSIKCDECHDWKEYDTWNCDQYQCSYSGYDDDGVHFEKSIHCADCHAWTEYDLWGCEDYEYYGYEDCYDCEYEELSWFDEQSTFVQIAVILGPIIAVVVLVGLGLRRCRGKGQGKNQQVEQTGRRNNSMTSGRASFDTRRNSFPECSPPVSAMPFQPYVVNPAPPAPGVAAVYAAPPGYPGTAYNYNYHPAGATMAPVAPPMTAAATTGFVSAPAPAHAPPSHSPVLAPVATAVATAAPIPAAAAAPAASAAESQVYYGEVQHGSA